jgi:NAD(P)-dependent dehydrogenase (short-subunit alcohol dehydrogenase family)
LAPADAQRVAQVINGNLTGAFYVAQAALGLMRAQKEGLMIPTVVGRPLHRPGRGTGLHCRQAWHGSDELQPQS